jgi:DNA-binding NarL/FixJ family response regulator
VTERLKSGKVLRILIVEDHPIMRFGIAAIVNAQPDMTVVGQAETAAQALDLFRATHPDLTLMDLRLPDGSGVAVIRAICAENPSARVVVLTTYEGDEDIHQALAAGAQGYLIKGMSHELLLKALRRVEKGQRFLPPMISETLSHRPSGSHLTQRELEVLQLMFGGRSNREIAEDLGIKEATVKTHVSVILMRLNVTDRTQAVVEALKRGLIHL